jgi:hypothetical protein
MTAARAQLVCVRLRYPPASVCTARERNQVTGSSERATVAEGPVEVGQHGRDGADERSGGELRG